MSELYFKFQVPASNTLGGVGETRTVLKSLTDVRMDKGKTICPSPFSGGGLKMVSAVLIFSFSMEKRFHNLY